MIEAYFDESGIHDKAAICVIAGYWGLASQWKWMGRKWRAILNEFQFPLKDFHATDLINAKRHQSMLQRLADDAIGKSAIYPVSASIIVDDFNSFSEKQRRWFTGATLNTAGKLITSGAPTKPYFVPFQLCIRNITEQVKPGRKAHFFFGTDRPMSKYARVLFRQIKTDRAYSSGWPTKSRLGDPAFPAAKDTPQLQAADLLVHLTYRHELERLAENNWNVEPTGLLRACLRKIRRQEDHVLQDRRCLQWMLDVTNQRFGRWDN